jgi:hypothetical protein
MSKLLCDAHTLQPHAGPLFFETIDLPGAPPSPPIGHALYENLSIRIDRDDLWYYHGSPIQRKELLCSFACVPTRGAAGQHRLATPPKMLFPLGVSDEVS